MEPAQFHTVPTFDHFLWLPSCNKQDASALPETVVCSGQPDLTCSLSLVIKATCPPPPPTSSLPGLLSWGLRRLTCIVIVLIGTYLIQILVLHTYRILNWVLNAFDRDTLVLPPYLVPPRILLTVMALTVMPASQAAGQLLGAGGAGGIYLLGGMATMYVLSYLGMLAWALHTISRKAWAMGVVFGTFGNFYAPAGDGDGPPRPSTASDTSSRPGTGNVYLQHRPSPPVTPLSARKGPAAVAESVEPNSISRGPSSGAAAPAEAAATAVPGRGTGAGRRALHALCWPVHAASHGLKRCCPPYSHWLKRREEAAGRKKQEAEDKKKEKQLKRAQRALDEAPSRVAFLAMQCPSKLPVDTAADMLDIAVKGLDECYKDVADPWIVAASLTDLGHYTNKPGEQGGKLKTKLKARAKAMATAWIVSHKGGEVEMVAASAAEASSGNASATIAAASSGLLLDHEQDEQVQHLFGDTLPWDTIPVFDPAPADKDTQFWSIMKSGLLATWTWIKVDCFSIGTREGVSGAQVAPAGDRGEQLWEHVKARGRVPGPTTLYVPLPLGADGTVLEAAAAQVGAMGNGEGLACLRACAAARFAFGFGGILHTCMCPHSYGVARGPAASKHACTGLDAHCTRACTHCSTPHCTSALPSPTPVLRLAHHSSLITHSDLLHGHGMAWHVMAGVVAPPDPHGGPQERAPHRVAPGPRGHGMVA